MVKKHIIKAPLSKYSDVETQLPDELTIKLREFLKEVELEDMSISPMLYDTDGTGVMFNVLSNNDGKIELTHKITLKTK